MKNQIDLWNIDQVCQTDKTTTISNEQKTKMSSFNSILWWKSEIFLFKWEKIELSCLNTSCTMNCVFEMLCHKTFQWTQLDGMKIVHQIKTKFIRRSLQTLSNVIKSWWVISKQNQSKNWKQYFWKVQKCENISKCIPSSTKRFSFEQIKYTKRERVGAWERLCMCVCACVSEDSLDLVWFFITHIKKSLNFLIW